MGFRRIRVTGDTTKREREKFKESRKGMFDVSFELSKGSKKKLKKALKDKPIKFKGQVARPKIKVF